MSDNRIDTDYSPEINDPLNNNNLDPASAPSEPRTAYDIFLEEKASYSAQDQANLYGNIEGFLGASKEQKLSALEERKTKKLGALGEKSQFTSLSKSYTELEDGTIESNANKIWNELSGAEYTSLFNYAMDNLALGQDDQGYFFKSTGERFKGPTRRSYGYNTKTSDDIYKFGVARGDRDSSDSRYTDYATGADGVDISKKQHDILLPDYIANTLEGLGHGRKAALQGRVVKDSFDFENYDRFGSGGTEYYNSKEAFFGDSSSEDYGKALDEAAAKELLYDYANKFTTPSKYYKGSYSDDKYIDSYYQKLADKVVQERYENQTVFGEALQTLSGLPAGAAKGALELLDVGQEMLTYLPQLAARVVTGDDSIDIDLFDDGFKKAAIEFTDSIVGYDRKLDELVMQDAMKDFEESGIDITSWESIKEAFSDPEKLSKLGAGAWKLLTDPSLTASMVTEVIGSGGALGGATKVGSKVASKVVPNAQKKVSEVLQSNLTKLRADVAAADSADKVLELQKNYTILQKIPDLLKGTVYTNADMMVRMNNDITAFKENNNGEDPGVGKLLQIATLNRLVSTAEVISLKSLAGIKDVPSKVVKEATKKGIITAAGETGFKLVKNGLMEGSQETLDSIVEQINQKVDSADFKDKSVTDVLSEASAEILTGTLAGVGSGVQIGVGSIGLDGIRKAGGKVGEGIQKKAVAKKETEDTADIPITDPEVSTEDVETTAVETDKKANATIRKYASMLDEQELVAINTSDDTTVQDVNTPVLDEAIADSDSTYADTIAEIEAAETIIQSRADTERKTDADELGLKVLRKARLQASKKILESEEVPTLGSGYSVEDVVDDFIQAKVEVEGDLDSFTEEEKTLVNTFLEKNGKKPYRFNKVREKLEGKDSFAVYEDSMDSGANSATSRRARLKNLVNTPSVNKSLVKKEVEGIKNFLNTQVDRKKAYTTTRDELQKDIDNYNKNPIGPAPKRRYIPGTDKKNFIQVTKNPNGTVKINESSQALLDSIDDNIDHLTTTLNRYNKATATILGSTNDVDSSFLVVPASNVKNEGVKASREKDVAFYEKYKPTKVILDEDTSSKKWKKDGEYQSLNESKIALSNTEFSEGDTVLLTSLTFKKGSKASRALSKAIQAGATIVLDSSVKTDKKTINRIAKAYKAGAVNVDGKSVWVPREKALAVRKEQTIKNRAKNAKESTLKRLVQAFDNDQTSKTKESRSALLKAITFAETHFTGKDSKKKLNDFIKNRLAKESENLKTALTTIMLAEGTDSKAYAEAISNAEFKTSVRIADKAVKAEEARLAKGGTLVKEWNQALETAKKGGTDLTSWVKSTFGDTAKSIGKTLLSNSLGKAEASDKVIYSYRTKNSTTFTTTTKLSDVEKFSEDGVYHVIEVDPEKYVDIKEATVLNTISVEDLKLEGEENALFNNFVEESLESMENAIAKNTKSTTVLPFNVIDSPAISLIYDTEGKINANVAVAVRVALYNFIRNNNYLLAKDNKTLQDIADILGKHESELSESAIAVMQDKGLLFKTAADSIGKDIAQLMGMQAKKSGNVDSQLYKALTTELGQIALLVGMTEKEGMLAKTSMPSKKFAKEVLGKKFSDVAESDSVVNFVEIKNPANIESAIFTIDVINNILPGMDVRRKEPSFTPLSDKDKKEAHKKIRKERLGIDVPAKSKEDMDKLMDTEMVADMPLLRFVINPENKMRIMQRLGYVDLDLESEEFKKLSYKEQQVQASKNRDLERNMENLEWLNSSADNNQNKVSMWFNYFFSKNGRFFVDSNTINPQTNKHLDRFLVQPKEHNNTYSKKGNKFYSGKKDVTSLVHYALAQGFGLATDKKAPSEIKAFAINILENIKSLEELNKARETFLDTGEVKALVIKIEHLGHALQAFDFLEKTITNPKKIESPITAEFDAVTSGFALKLLQMPIIGKKLYTWLGKVGIFTKNDKDLDNLSVEDGLSMNSVLSQDGFLDSYQFLANSIKAISYSKLRENAVDSKLLSLESGYTKNLWDAVSKVLPTVDEDGGISSDLRSLFKYPFMTFNYASSVSSIRKRLKGTMQDDIAKKIAKIDLTNIQEKEKVLVDMLAVFAESNEPAVLQSLQDQVREKPLVMVKVGKGASLGNYLDDMIDASYGVQVESVLNNEFAPFVEAQEAINNSFKAMFEVFSISFEEKLREARKQGAVSAEKEKEIYNSLKNQWPAIKGPLSSMEEEFSSAGGIGVYSTDTASPYGIYAGRKAAITKVSEELKKDLGASTIRTSHMIKALSAAVSAGSVIPIHYIDGAVMGATISNMDGNMTSIHDAVMPSLLRMGEAQQYYNKATLEVSASYSFINEIVQSLDRIIQTTEIFGTKGPSIYQKAKVTTSDKEETNATSYLVETRNSMATIANKVNKSRKELFDTLNKGSHVMHMAGTPDGVFNVDEDNQIAYQEIDTYEQIKDNTTYKVVNNTSEQQLNDLAKNHCRI